MRSLRGRLLLSLWIAVSVLAVLSAAVAYVQVRHQARQLLDDQLQQMAAVAVSQSKATTGAIRNEDNDIEVAVWDHSGALQYSSSPAMIKPQSASQGFSDVQIGQDDYRLYARNIDGRRVEVAQPADVRDDQAEAAALAALLPM